MREPPPTDVGFRLPTTCRRSRPALDRVLLWSLAGFIVAPTHIWAPVTFAGHGITLSLVAGAALVIAGIHRIPRAPGIVLVFSLFMLVSVYGLMYSALFATDSEVVSRAFRHWVLMAFCICVFAAASTSRFTWACFDSRLTAISATYVVVVVFGIYQAFARRLGLPFAYLLVTNPTLSTDVSGLQPGATSDNAFVYITRASSFFVEPTNLGMFLAFGAAFGLALVVRGGKIARVGYIGLGMTGVGFAANQSLTGVLACGVVLALNMLAGLAGKRPRMALVIVGAITVSIASLQLLPGALEALGERLLSFSFDNSSMRYTAVPVVLAALVERPFGLGLAGHVQLGEIQNGMLVLLAELGIWGLSFPIVWGARIFQSWRSAVACLRSREPDRAAQRVLAFSLLAVHVCIWLSSGTLYDPFYWTMSGVGWAALRAQG